MPPLLYPSLPICAPLPRSYHYFLPLFHPPLPLSTIPLLYSHIPSPPTTSRFMPVTLRPFLPLSFSPIMILFSRFLLSLVIFPSITSSTTSPPSPPFHDLPHPSPQPLYTLFFPLPTSPSHVLLFHVYLSVPLALSILLSLSFPSLILSFAPFHHTSPFRYPFVFLSINSLLTLSSFPSIFPSTAPFPCISAYLPSLHIFLPRSHPLYPLPSPSLRHPSFALISCSLAIPPPSSPVLFIEGEGSLSSSLFRFYPLFFNLLDFLSIHSLLPPTPYFYH